MGTIKIELDLPEFNKEIELRVVLNKDGVQSGTPLVYKQVDKVDNGSISINPVPMSIPTDSGGGWKESVIAPPTPSTHSAFNSTANTQPSSTGIPSSMMGTY